MALLTRSGPHFRSAAASSPARLCFSTVRTVLRPPAYLATRAGMCACQGSAVYRRGRRKLQTYEQGQGARGRALAPGKAEARAFATFTT